MDLFKKARSHVKVAVKEIHEVVQQGQQQWDAKQQQQQQQQQQAPQYYQQQHHQQQYQPGHGQGQYQQGQGNYYYPQDQQYQPPPPQHQQQYHQYGAPPAQAPQYNGYEQQQQYQYQQPQQYQAPPPQHHPGYSNQYSPPSGPPPPQSVSPQQTQPAAPTPVQPREQQQPSTHHHHHAAHPPPGLPKAGGKCLAKDFVPIETNHLYTIHPHLRASFQLEDVDFTLCANCYASLVAPNAQLAANFVSLEKPAIPAGSVSLVSGKAAVCHAITPRTRLALRQCISSGSIQPVVDYVRLIKTLSGCDGSPVPSTQAAWAAKGTDGVAVCTSCYEQFVRHTPFERHFKHSVGEFQGDWICDVGSEGVLSRVLIEEVLSASPNYKRFTSVASDWTSAPACPGEGVALQNSGSNKAFVAQNGHIGVFCRACYTEHLVATPFQHLVKETTLSDDELATVPCNLASSFAKFALKKAIARDDFRVWGKAVPLNGKVPPCEGVKGVDEATLRGPDSFSWYKMKDYPTIEVCPSCYHVCLEVFGLEGLFEPIDRPLVDGFVRQCFMPLDIEHTDTALEDSNDFPSTIAWRGRMLREGIAFYSSSHGDLSIFKGYADKIARMPTPCFSNSRACFPVNGRRWFGRSAQPGVPGDFHYTVCEECFINCVQGTPLEHMLNGDATVAVNKQELGFVCQAYSSRTRKVLKEAMVSGNWEHFTDHWRKRDEVRTRYFAAKERETQQMQKMRIFQAQIDQEGAMASIKLMQGLTANTNSVIAGIGGSVAEASATDYGQRFGNSSVGYGYLTHNGARAAMDKQQAIEYAASMPVKDMRLYQNSGDTISDSFVIHAIVEEVTKEWRAIE